MSYRTTSDVIQTFIHNQKHWKLTERGLDTVSKLGNSTELGVPGDFHSDIQGSCVTIIELDEMAISEFYGLHCEWYTFILLVKATPSGLLLADEKDLPYDQAAQRVRLPGRGHNGKER